MEFDIHIHDRSNRNDAIHRIDSKLRLLKLRPYCYHIVIAGELTVAVSDSSVNPPGAQVTISGRPFSVGRSVAVVDLA